MKQFRIILICITLIVTGFIAFKYLNSGGGIIPLKESTSSAHPTKEGYQDIKFKFFNITLPNGWKDKGFIYGEEAEIRGELKKDKQVLVYEYGITAYSPTETLNEFLYIMRNNSMIMGTEKKVGESDSTTSVTYTWPIDPSTSDTIHTGILNDSLCNLHPKLTAPHPFVGTPNYYSFTSYNDSVYFVPIEVPEVIINSDITNFKKADYYYNLVVPKDKKVGFTKIVCNKSNYFRFTLWGDSLDSNNQDILINAGLSMRFNEEYKLKH